MGKNNSFKKNNSLKKKARVSERSFHKEVEKTFQKYGKSMAKRQGKRATASLSKAFLDFLPGDSFSCGSDLSFGNADLKYMRRFCFKCNKHFGSILTKVNHALTCFQLSNSTRICRSCFCLSNSPYFHTHKINVNLREIFLGNETKEKVHEDEEEEEDMDEEVDEHDGVEQEEDEVEEEGQEVEEEEEEEEEQMD